MGACVDESQALAYVRGGLTAAEVARVDEHAESCSDCRRFLSELARQLPPAELQLADTSPAEFGPLPLLSSGDALGRYLVLQRIGAGGMGVVFSAYDPDLDRKVALKLLRKTGADATVARLRLLREAQALARLSHPNVVAVHDLGTWEGQVFLAMELIDGGTVSAWLAERPRSSAEVLRVFLAAGRGLAAAHAAGIVHRDFKPDNVLVGKDGRICVTDFGLARTPGIESLPAGPPSPLPATVLTATGAILGTPRYMAPEQQAGDATDARSDQYSYCVALWEALYGKLPGDGEAGRGRLRRTILRGLSKDPQSRWRSMDQLLESLARDPLLRRRSLLVTGGVLLLAAGAVLVPRWIEAQRTRLCRAGEQQFAAVWSADRQARAHAALTASGRPFAEDAWSRLRQIVAGYQSAWTGMHREACEATRVSGHQTEEVLGLRITCLDRRLDEAGALFSLMAGGEIPPERVVAAAQALSPVSGCADVAGLSAPVKPPRDPAARARVDGLRKELAVATADQHAGRYREALARLTPLAKNVEDVGYQPLMAEVGVARGQAQYSLSQMKEAEATFYDAIYAAEASHHDDICATAWLELLENVGYGQDRPADARRIARHAEAAIARLQGRRRDLEANLNDQLSGVALREENYAESERYARRYLELSQKVAGADSGMAANALNNHAVVLRILHQYPQALAENQKALAIKERVAGPHHPSVADCHVNLAGSYMDVSRVDDAIAEYRRAQEIDEVARPDGVELGGTLTGLAEALSYKGDHDGAIASFERAIAILTRAAGEEHTDVAEAHGRLAEAFLRARKYPQALVHARRAVEIQEKVGPDTLPAAGWLSCVGDTYLRMGQAREAVKWTERAVRLHEQVHAGEEDRAAARFVLAEALWASGGDRARARALVEAARRGVENGNEPWMPELRRRANEWLERHPH